MPVHVAFTPDEEAPAAVGIVVDVLRATSTIAQALASGYRRVLCCSELDDVYCAGRFVELLGPGRTHAAIGAALVAQAFPTASDGLNARTYGPPGLEEDIVFCARENLLDVVPRFTGMVGAAAEIMRAG